MPRLSRLRHALFVVSAAVSLALFAGTIGLWARSYSVGDMMRRQDVWYTSAADGAETRRDWKVDLVAARGVLQSNILRVDVASSAARATPAATRPATRSAVATSPATNGGPAPTRPTTAGARAGASAARSATRPAGGATAPTAQHESAVWWAHRSPPRVLLRDAPMTLTFWRRLGFRYQYQHTGSAASGKVDQWQLGLPYWLAAVAFASLPVRWLGVGARRWRRRRKGWCVRCGYDLSGNVSGVCPECGTPAGAATLNRPVERPFPAP